MPADSPANSPDNSADPALLHKAVLAADPGSFPVNRVKDQGDSAAVLVSSPAGRPASRDRDRDSVLADSTADHSAARDLDLE